MAHGKILLWVWALPLPAVWWAALAAAEVKASGGNLFDLLARVSAPEWPGWSENAMKYLFLFTLAYLVCVFAFLSSRKNYRRGVEHGSAKWGEVRQITKKYQDKTPEQNLILTQHFRLGGVPPLSIRTRGFGKTLHGLPGIVP